VASTLDEFFQYLHTELTLPVSRLTVVIRKPDLMSLVGLGELPIPTPAPDPQDASATPSAAAMSLQDINRYTERIIAEGVVSPRFTDQRGDTGKPIYGTHAIHVSMLDTADRDFLATALFQKLGLTTGDAVAIHAFREDEQRQNDPSVSPGVSVPSE
jgi:hypothetical protein